MTLRDWIIVVGLAVALPVWGYTVFNQWSNRPGAMGRMLGGCGVFAAILLIAMAGAYLTGP